MFPVHLKMSLFPKNTWEEICQREINVTGIYNFVKGGKLIENVEI